jgi:Tol biopolymer transport system component
MQTMTPSPRRCSPLFRLIIGVVLAASLIGCGGKVALKPMWVPCPEVEIYDPVWSPDSMKVAYFTSAHRSGSKALYSYDVMSDTTTKLADMSAKSFHAVWSPDGDQLLIAYDTTGSNYELITIDLNSTKHVITGSIDGKPLYYQWSSDGEHIAIASRAAADRGDMVVLNRNGDIIWRLSEIYTDTLLVSSVEWSFDGSYLAIGLGTKLAIASANGVTLEIYPSPNGVTQSIQWSPDQKWIAFLTFNGSNRTFAVNLVKSDGTNLRILAYDHAESFRWLPDSSGIIYHIPNAVSDYEIVTLSLDVARKVVSSGQQDNRYGGFDGREFSPDATMFVYVNSGQYGADDLYIMNIDGTNVQQLTDNPGNHKCFQWPF